MFRIRCFVNKSILMNLYYSLIYPHLLYAVQVWGSTFETSTDKIFVLQKKTVRMMTFNVTFFSNEGPPAHSAPLFKMLKILKLKDIFKLRVSQFIYDSINGLAPNQFKDWFVFVNEIHSHNTRSNLITDNICDNGESGNEVDLSGNLFIPYARTTHYGLKSIKVSGPKIWNNIPHPIRNARSRVSFIKSFKNNILLHY